MSALIAEVPADSESAAQAALHDSGKVTVLPPSNPQYSAVINEAQGLLSACTSGYRLIMTEDRLADIKRRYSALEITFPNVQTVNLSGNITLDYVKLFIPLSGQYSNGTIFFLGAYRSAADKVTYSKLIQEKTYSNLRFKGGSQKLNQLIQDLRGK